MFHLYLYESDCIFICFEFFRYVIDSTNSWNRNIFTSILFSLLVIRNNYPFFLFWGTTTSGYLIFLLQSFRNSFTVSGSYPNRIRLSLLKITGSATNAIYSLNQSSLILASILSFSTLSLYVEISKYPSFFCQSSIHARSHL